MIKKQNKRLEITLTLEEYNLLSSLSSRFNISKSDCIKQALRVFASKRTHHLTISYKEITIEEPTKGLIKKTKEESQISDEEWNKAIGIEEEKETPIENDELPF